MLISQSVALWYIQAPVATLLQSYNVVQLLSGVTGESLNQRIDSQPFLYGCEKSTPDDVAASIHPLVFPFAPCVQVQKLMES